MGEQITFLKAMVNHLKLPSESLTDFRREYSRLTERDKLDLRQQFEREFGYTVVESKGP